MATDLESEINECAELGLIQIPCCPTNPATTKKVALKSTSASSGAALIRSVSCPSSKVMTTLAGSRRRLLPYSHSYPCSPVVLKQFNWPRKASSVTA